MAKLATNNKLVQEAINKFTHGNLKDNSINFFGENVLGYNTQRQRTLNNKSFQGFKNEFDLENYNFNETKALVHKWKEIDLLFQITDDEIKNEITQFASVDNDLFDSYLFFSLELENSNEKNYTKTEISDITREINKIFPMPIMIFFKYNDFITIDITDRRRNKTDEDKHVLEKVTLIKDININKPNRGQIEILLDLSFNNLLNKYKFKNFEELHQAWQKTLDTSELNKKFYKELSNWYFWAVKQVTFPNEPTLEHAFEQQLKIEDMIQEHKAKNVIRMLTRLLFVWFIKEKDLIPEQLFDLKIIQNDILKEFSPIHQEGLFQEANRESIYYKAILQNLFFATLNCPIKAIDKNDNRVRAFRKNDHYGQQRDSNFLMRYEKYFQNPEKFLQMVNDVVPFLNGGLFECLDDKANKIYIDGFSDNMIKGEQLIFPDYLFFGIEEKVDLSTEYGIKNKGTQEAAVKGLINILKHYKFTVDENTPLEEEIALDPELLGKVFENLLASYNPETKTTARKQTGSFYTPREIVNYMVDESLIAYLKEKILETEKVFLEVGNKQTQLIDITEGKNKQLIFTEDLHKSRWIDKEEELENDLRVLFSYSDQQPFLVHEDIEKLVRALDNCKILDPACGSGAFPMGILQKMVHVLKKLDPQNELWKKIQKEKINKETNEAFKIENREERNDSLIEISNAFDERINAPNYARKLYLIENCIYGVDIQPIATQISKLRFFISLIIDQKMDKSQDNFGIRTLPNLETKFVAANSLIGIEKPKEMSIFETSEINKLEEDLKNNRHKIFSSKTPAKKKVLRERD
ncbi:MAG: hypothetical protein H7263_07045, partial [Candidatus Sericytochromatia bacterium]|nr:hypothetical protein [Candidatus Sericytochromatia bacterium]